MSKTCFLGKALISFRRKGGRDVTMSGGGRGTALSTNNTPPTIRIWGETENISHEYFTRFEGFSAHK